ncbi:hypothetical protein [Streptomyces olivaceoviridis]|uniref:hypothetical protein n=1 Tax=Streptomyces olivaceoviridis TaxID=1921 RepID=UPI0027E40764|nr:hypothetical protein [Streptomyces olivaceoviridis]
MELAEQAWPYLSTAVSAYGVGVLTRAEDAAVEATANLGRRILQAVWRQRGEQGRAELEAAVQDVAADLKDGDAAAALRQQVKRALREDAELREELAEMLSAAGAGPVNVTASGERSIAAQTIGTAVTGDNVTLRP